jgi:S1-C subfamily serine protease
MYSIPQKEGLIVVQVIPRSPAALKGIRPGDVIIEASGRKFVRASDLRNAIEDSYGSDCIDLKIYREPVRGLRSIDRGMSCLFLVSNSCYLH